MTQPDARPSDARPSDARPSDARPSDARPSDARTASSVDPHPAPERKAWMAVLAKAAPPRLKALAEDYLGSLSEEAAPAFTMLRRPETGLVMVRARAGGAGAPFNMGEMTATRCTVLLNEADGTQTTGVAYIAGRDQAHAALAAKLDALLQTAAHHDAVQARIVHPLERERAARRTKRRAQVGATKVDFFTLVRGED
ncbi:MAG: phosphonate C-P lyase system protein PhnG [Marivibrio sp.]|uniref:phosphonate C-P lyase system protein PhnG n=1 Tax=Marivibrio sp. TaxID=2039719 RepID=UPI0032EF887A